MGLFSFFHIPDDIQKKADELYNESVGIKPKKNITIFKGLCRCSRI